jgi:hypothetical protein
VDRTENQTEEPEEDLSLYFEATKHLTTLSSGSIVLIGIFLKDIFPNEAGALTISLPLKILIALSFLTFAISLMLSAGHLLLIGETVRFRTRPEYSYYLPDDWRLAFLPWVAYIVGLLFFGIAVLTSLFF